MAKQTTGPRHFRAILQAMKNDLGWTVVSVPFDPAMTWPERIRNRVQGTVNGVPFRTSLFPDAARPGRYVLLVTRATQAAAKVGIGQEADILLEPDMEPRSAELPEELDALLEDEPDLRTWYDSLSEYTRREIGKWVQDVKSDAARQRRAQQMAERMLFAMEAEAELPPAIAKALKARPQAHAGWKKMTPTQRRMELFAVGYYQTPEARQKRIEKLCAEAEKRAMKTG